MWLHTQQVLYQLSHHLPSTGLCLFLSYPLLIGQTIHMLTYVPAEAQSSKTLDISHLHSTAMRIPESLSGNLVEIP